MRDTVELLEAIGRDPYLRHASPEELTKALEDADASEGLRELVASGDSTALTRELGLVQMHVEHHSQTGGHEGDCDDDGDDDGDDDDDGKDGQGDESGDAERSPT